MRQATRSWKQDSRSAGRPAALTARRRGRYTGGASTRGAVARQSVSPSCGANAPASLFGERLVRGMVSTRVALCAALLAAACGRSEPYHIGVVLGNDGIAGARLAAEAVNVAGGVNGHPLVLDSMPGLFGTSAERAIDAARRLAGDPSVLAVVGHSNSNSSLAASQVYNAQHVVQIAPTTSTPLYSEAGPYSFRLVASDVHQGAFLAARVLARQPRDRVAVLYVNDDYGRSLHRALVARLHDGGLTPVYDAPYSEDGPFTDAGVIARSLAGARPGLLVWLGRAERYVALRDSLEARLPGLAVLASDGFGGPTVEAGPPQRFHGVSYVRMVDLSQPAPATRRFVDGYRALLHSMPTDQAALSYDAVTLLAEAMRQAGPHRDAIRDWLDGVGRTRPGFTGLGGPIVFTPKGDRTPAYHVVTIGADGR